MKNRRHAHLLLCALMAPALTAIPAAAQDFSYLPPGDLLSGSGVGRVDCTVYAPGIRYPIEDTPSYPNSQVYNPGGSAGGGGSQCSSSNYDYPWQDNFCEYRSSRPASATPMCPDQSQGHHQGQDIRPSTCSNNTYWVVSSTSGTVTHVPTASTWWVDVTASDGSIYSYLHMSSIQVSVGESVSRGERLGKVSNQFGGTPTTIHLHYEIHRSVSGFGFTPTPPYASLAAAYREQIGELGVGGGARATANLNVRSSPGGSAVGTASAGDTGTIIGGPTVSNYAGYCWIWWRIDWGGGLSGWSVDNYLEAAAAGSGPDLIVISMAVSDTTLQVGQSFTASATVRNQGDASSDSTTLRYYRSTNSTITTSDTQLSTDPVSSLSPGGDSPESDSESISVAGTFWIGACVDSVSGESDTGNNCSSGVQVTVGGGASGPDLVVTDMAVSDTTLQVGQSFTASATVHNQGGAASNSTTLRYYRSTNSTISTSDTQLSTDPVTSLAPGGDSPESDSESINVAGTFWIGACVDSVSGESDTGNNCSSGVQVTVGGGSSGPDLIVTDMAVSDTTLEVGQSFTASATVRNQGDANSDSTTLRYYRSTNSTITTSDTQLSTDPVSSLSPGGDSPESDSESISVAGTFWIGACVDSVSGESNTGNNCSSGVQVGVSGCADDQYESTGSGSTDDTCFGSEIQEGSSQSHLHCDEDWVHFQPLTGATYEIETGTLLAGADTVIELRRACGTLLDSDDDGGAGLASKLTYTAVAADNRLDVRITQFADNYSDGEGYDVGVTCVQDCGCVGTPNLVLSDDTITTSEVYEACNTIFVGPNWMVMGPGGAVTLVAGESVVLGDGAAVGIDGSLTIEIDPSLRP